MEYEKPSMEIQVFEEDIITTSSTELDVLGGGDPGSDSGTLEDLLN